MKNRRRDIIMETQSRIAAEYNEAQVGRTLEVLVEGYDRYAGCWFGRSAADAPGYRQQGVFHPALWTRPGEAGRHDQCQNNRCPGLGFDWRVLLLNLPNKLTVIRIILAPVFLLLMMVEFPFHYLAAGLVFGAASLTDLFDGRIARRDGLITDLGKFLDPLADKMLTTAAFFGLSGGGCPGCGH